MITILIFIAFDWFLLPIQLLSNINISPLRRTLLGAIQIEEWIVLLYTNTNFGSTSTYRLVLFAVRYVYILVFMVLLNHSTNDTLTSLFDVHNSIFYFVKSLRTCWFKYSFPLSVCNRLHTLSRKMSSNTLAISSSLLFFTGLTHA